MINIAVEESKDGCCRSHAFYTTSHGPVVFFLQHGRFDSCPPHREKSRKTKRGERMKVNVSIDYVNGVSIDMEGREIYVNGELLDLEKVERITVRQI